MFGVLEQSCVESPCYENDAFRILMLLYYCCGLRKAEAQELKLGDINFETGKISILHGKNDVARIIPVSDSLLAQLRLHRKTYLENPSQEDFFFFREKKRATVAGDIYRKFRLPPYRSLYSTQGPMGDGSACMTYAIPFA